MDKIDVFISYSSKDGKLVVPIVIALEQIGIKCWYADRDCKDRYAKSICDAIGNAKLFLLCLTKNSAVSEHVLNEVEIAYKKRKKTGNSITIVPLSLEKIDLEDEKFDEILYYIQRINFIIPSTNNPVSIANEIVSKSNDILRIELVVKKDRVDSSYYSSDREDARLIIQDQLLRNFDYEIYKKNISGYDNPTILDVGCGNGNTLFGRLDFLQGNYKLIGLERDEPKVVLANKNIASKAHASFYVQDVQSNDFETDLKRIMTEQNIENFDVINISMLLLHLKGQCRLFRALRRVLSSNGVIIIKDVDDGINFFYPDVENLFEHVYKICDNNETSGVRRNGRQIYTNLIRAGFLNNELEKQGFSSIGMSYDEKEAFFNLYFEFILRDVRWMHEKYPTNEEIANDCRWYEENYEKIFELFMKEDSVFSLGVQIYTARK